VATVEVVAGAAGNIARVRAIGVGNAIITATTADGGHISTSSITVTAAQTLIPFNIFSEFNPGIPGGIPNVYTIHTIIDPAVYGNGTTDARAAINTAIQEAGDVATATNRQVVYLPPGIYRISGYIRMNRSNVVLRGAGDDTIIRAFPITSAGTAGYTGIRIGQHTNFTSAD